MYLTSSIGFPVNMKPMLEDKYTGQRSGYVVGVLLCFLLHKILNGHCDMVLNVAPGSSVTRRNNFKVVKQPCSIGVRKFCIAIELLSTHGTVYLILYYLLHKLIILK